MQLIHNTYLPAKLNKKKILRSLEKNKIKIILEFYKSENLEIMRKFYLLFATLCCMFMASATDYVVSGSYYQELNGLYVESGTKDGYPYFVKTGENEYDEMGIAYQWGNWVIGRHYGNGYVMDYERSYDQGIPPLTGWGGGISMAANGPIE